MDRYGQVRMDSIIIIIFSIAQFQLVHGKCGEEIHAELHPNGQIISPGYPDHYPENLECTWIIKAPSGEKIHLEFTDFDMTGSLECTGDYIKVIHSTDDSEVEVELEKEKRYCGSDIPLPVTSEEEHIMIVFRSNKAGSCRGFNATYKLIEESLSCGSRTSAAEFTFISPEYPESVGNDSLQCTLTVDHSCENQICQLRLDFDDFRIQPPFWGECNHDKFYAESASPLPSLCGNNNGSHMYIGVQGRSKTDLTFLLKDIEYYLYHCYDIYGAYDHKTNTNENFTNPHDNEIRMNLPSKAELSPQKERIFDGVNHVLSRHRRQVTTESSTTGETSEAVETGSSTVNSITAEPRSSTAAPGSSLSPGSSGNGATTTRPQDITVALYNYEDNEVVSFPTDRKWKIRVTQIPCDCPESRAPPAPSGCLQYHQGITGSIKSFNFESLGCYSEDRWCNFKTIKHESDCDIRVGYSGHLNNLDYAICIEPEAGFCGIEYRQEGAEGFSLSNITDFSADDFIPSSQFGDMGCMSDYLWIAGAESPRVGETSHERFCGTLLGNGRKTGTIISYSKPFVMRAVSDADEYSLVTDYMNRGFHLAYSQIPCKAQG